MPANPALLEDIKQPMFGEGDWILPAEAPAQSASPEAAEQLAEPAFGVGDFILPEETAPSRLASVQRAQRQHQQEQQFGSQDDTIRRFWKAMTRFGALNIAAQALPGTKHDYDVSNFMTNAHAAVVSAFEGVARLPNVGSAALEHAGRRLQESHFRMGMSVGKQPEFLKKVGSILELVGWAGPQTKHQELSQKIAEDLQAFRETNIKPLESEGRPWTWDWFVANTGQATGHLAVAASGGLAAGAVTGSATVSAMVGGMTAGAIEAGLSFEDYKARLIERGYTEQEAEDIASFGAVGYGAAAGVVEVFPMMAIFGKVPGFRKLWMRALLSSLAEGNEEGIQDLLDRTARVMSDVDPEALADWTPEQYAQVFVPGFFAGGGMSSVMTGIQAGQENPGQAFLRNPTRRNFERFIPGIGRTTGEQRKKLRDSLQEQIDQAGAEPAEVEEPTRAEGEAQVTAREDGGILVSHDGGASLVVKNLGDGNFEVIDVTVPEQQRRRGIATLLYKQAIESIEEQGGKLFTSTEQTDAGKLLHESLDRAGFLGNRVRIAGAHRIQLQEPTRAEAQVQEQEAGRPAVVEEQPAEPVAEEPAEAGTEDREGEGQEVEFDTPSATVRVDKNGFSHITVSDGSRVVFRPNNADFPNQPFERTRGELFMVETQTRRAGLGTSLVSDALRVMSANGATTVTMRVPNKKFGRPFVESLIRRGIISEPIRTSESGTTEHRILLPRSESGAEFVHKDSGQTALVSPSAQKTGQFQLTIFADGAPVRDMQFRSREEAITQLRRLGFSEKAGAVDEAVSQDDTAEAGVTRLRSPAPLTIEQPKVGSVKARIAKSIQDRLGVEVVYLAGAEETQFAGATDTVGRRIFIAADMESESAVERVAAHELTHVGGDQFLDALKAVDAKGFEQAGRGYFFDRFGTTEGVEAWLETEQGRRESAARFVEERANDAQFLKRLFGERPGLKQRFIDLYRKVAAAVGNRYNKGVLKVAELAESIEVGEQAAEPELAVRITPAKLESTIKSETGFVYHATNEDNLFGIAESGTLEPHDPDFGTDQEVWPDGSTEQRAYFSGKAGIVWQFAPEEGKPVVVRIKRDQRFFDESTGDVFSRESIPASELEYLGQDGNWHSVSDLAAPAAEPEQAVRRRVTLSERELFTQRFRVREAGRRKGRAEVRAEERSKARKLVSEMKAKTQALVSKVAAEGRQAKVEQRKVTFAQQKARRERVESLRKQFAGFIRDRLPKGLLNESELKRAIFRIQNVKTVHSLFKAINEVDAIVAKAETREAVEELKKALKAAGKISQRGAHQQEIADIMEGLSLSKPRADTISRAVAVLKAVGKDRGLTAETVDDAINPFGIPKKLLEKYISRLNAFTSRQVRDMDAEEIRTITASLLFANGLERTRNKLIGKKRVRDLKSAVDLLREQIAATRKKSREDEPGDRKKWQFIEAIFTTDQLTPDLTMRMIAGPDSVLQDVLIDQFREGESISQSIMQHAEQSLQQALENAGITGAALEALGQPVRKGKKLKGTSTVEVELPTAFWHREQTPEEKAAGRVPDRLAPSLSLRRGTWIWLLASLTDLDTRAQIISNRSAGIQFSREGERNTTDRLKLTIDDVVAIERHFRGSDEAKVAKFIVQYLNRPELRAMLDEVALNMLGHEIAINENYVPRTIDIEEAPEQAALAPWMMGRLEDQSFTKERIGSSKAIVIGDGLEQFFLHMNRVSAFIGKSEAIRDALAIVNNRRIKEMMNKRLRDPVGGRTRLMQFIKDYEGRDVAAMASAERAVETILRRGTVAALGLKPRIMVYQAYSFQFARRFFKGGQKTLARSYTVNKEWTKDKVNEAIAKYSARLLARSRGGGHQILTPSAGGQTLRRFVGLGEPLSDKFLKGITTVDAAVIRQIFRASIIEGTDKGLTGEALAEFAAKKTEHIVDKSQPTFDVTTRPQIVRMWRTGARMLPGVMFSSQRLKILNMQIETVLDYLESDRSARAKSKLVGETLEATVFNSMYLVMVAYLTSSIWKRLVGEDDEDRDKYLGDFMWDTLERMMGPLLIGGELATSLTKSLRRKIADQPVLRDYLLRDPILFEGLKGTIFALGEYGGIVIDLVQRDLTARDAVDEFIDTTVNEALKPLGIMTGTPTGAVKIMIDPFFSANIKGQYSVQYDNVWNAIKHEHQKNFNAAVDRLFEVNARERKMATAENARLDAKGLPTSKIPSKMNGARIKSSFTGRAGDDSELEQRGKDMLAAYWESKGRK